MTKCKYCGKELVKKRYSNGCLESDLQLSRRVYCDRDCMSKMFVKVGKTNQENRVAHATSRAINRRIMKKTECEICGKTGRLDVHHKDGDYTNNTVENLQVLCRSCHMKIHKPKPICKVEGCGKPVKGYGYCEKHFQRFKKYGDPLLTNRGHGHIVMAKD